MASLLGLSHELLHCIFAEIEPVDLSAISRTCRLLHGYVHGNRLLHKELYLRRYDEPTNWKQEPEWEEWIHQRTKLEKLLETEDICTKRQHLDFVAQQVDTLMKTAHTKAEKSKNIQFLTESFYDANNLDTFLCASSLFAPNRAGTQFQVSAATPELRQASAKLRCLYGVPTDTFRPGSLFSALQRSPDFAALSSALCARAPRHAPMPHAFARSKVYDLREYTPHTLWGPFMDDGQQRVDWEKAEAVMILLGFNLRRVADRSNGRFHNIWEEPWSGARPGSYQSAPRPKQTAGETDERAEDYSIRELPLSLDAQDPYGVTGSWMRVVCFLDYNDLYSFNFSERIPEDQLREPIDTEEAIRLIRIKLQVTRIDAPRRLKEVDEDGDEYGDGDGEEEEDEGLDWSNFRGERLPVVHFKGTSRSLHASWDPNANSKIRGIVRQTPEGEIRWTTFSIFHGEERWRSEGIQVGGLRSARGVLGNWFDKDYDMHGPAGPTAFWKESDQLEDEKTPSALIAFF